MIWNDCTFTSNVFVCILQDRGRLVFHPGDQKTIGDMRHCVREALEAGESPGKLRWLSGVPKEEIRRIQQEISR